MLLILRFAKYETIALGNSVSGKNNLAGRAGVLAPLAIRIVL
jgi:hypothetical protein